MSRATVEGWITEHMIKNLTLHYWLKFDAAYQDFAVCHHSKMLCSASIANIDKITRELTKINDSNGEVSLHKDES